MMEHMQKPTGGGRASLWTLGLVAGALALAAMRCGANPSGANPSKPPLEQSSSALTGQWLYLPLSKPGSDVNGYYGWNSYSGTCGTHYAEDLTGTQGDPVLAAADGNVLYAGPAYDGTGLSFVTLTHSNGYTTKYYHLQNLTALANGQAVGRGTKLGEIFSPLGGYSHVHFSVRNGTNNVNGCTLSNTTGGCENPGDPPGLPKSSSCPGDGADPGAGMWVTNSNGVVVLADLSNATTTNATVNVAVSTGAGTVTVTRNGTVIGSTTTSRVFNFNIGDTFVFQASPDSGYIFNKFCGDTACSITTTSNPFSGSITASSGDLFTYFDAASPTCPTGANWQLAGNYCWNEPGMSYTSASHLYNCQSAGGSAGDLGDCSQGCHNMPAGTNDICYQAVCPTGGYWYGAGLYCGLADGMSNAAPNIVYNCSSPGAYGSIQSVCGSNCVVAPPGVNDHC
jgi:murein DD-endopeptidase MepM/ murein hydrolase activator NlpD